MNCIDTGHFSLTQAGRQNYKVAPSFVGGLKHAIMHNIKLSKLYKNMLKVS